VKAKQQTFLRGGSAVLAIMLALSWTSSGASASSRAKRGAAPSVPGYGYLPGVRTSAQIARNYWRHHAPSFWYGYPGYYHGRWNGGGFGPCWTRTPIGPVWNCGR
jgi:hypothetical protein